MQSETRIFSGAFASPVLSAQAVFRALMDAMARPARIVSLKSDAQAPSPACPAIAALALTLTDADTPVWLSASLGNAAFARWLAFQTGAPRVSDRVNAMFAFAAREDALADFDGFSLGSDTYPDRATTLIIEVDGLTGGMPLLAKGPGIDGAATLAPRGLPPDFLQHRAVNRSLFPRGIDLILVAGTDCLCLPRTTLLSHQEI